MDPNQQNQQPYQMPQIPVKKSKKMIVIAGGIVGILVLVIGLLSVLVFQKNSTTAPEITVSPTTAYPSDLIATVGEERIYEDTLYRIAREQYRLEAINNSILKIALDTAIERAILDQEARRQKIVVTNQEIDQAAAESGDPSINKNVFKYQLLKQKITQSMVRSVVANTLGYWVPPPDEYPQEPIYDTQRIQGKQAMAEAADKLRNGQSLESITQELYQQYPALQNILAVNGYIYGGDNDPAIFNTPRTFEFTYDDDQEASLSPELIEILPQLKEGEVVDINRVNSSGGMVIQCLTVTSSGYESYEDFLTDQKQKMVKIIKPI